MTAQPELFTLPPGTQTCGGCEPEPRRPSEDPRDRCPRTRLRTTRRDHHLLVGELTAHAPCVVVAVFRDSPAEKGTEQR